MHVRPFLATAALVAIAAWGQQAVASPQTYTFDAPRFTLGESTPLINRAPNIGDASFRSDFMAGTTPALFVNSFQANPLFSGASLFSASSSVSTLTIAFNTPVDAVSFDFAIEASGQTLRVDSAAEDFNLVAGAVGAGFPGGAADLHFSTPISSLVLSVLNAPRSGFAIDNLVLQSVPEPGTLALLTGALLGLAGRRRQVR